MAVRAGERSILTIGTKRQGTVNRMFHSIPPSVLKSLSGAFDHISVMKIYTNFIHGFFL